VLYGFTQPLENASSEEEDFMPLVKRRRKANFI